MAITINGSAITVAGVAAGGINDNVVDNGTMADDAIGIAELSATGTASSSTYLRGDNSWAALSTGKILQVVQTAKTDTTTMSSTTTFTDITGMSLSITPAATSSKVLVQFHINVSNKSNGALHVRLVRDSTAIAIGDTSSSRGPVTVMGAAVQHGNDMKVRSMLWLDSPNTTSATTYKLQWQGGIDPVLNMSKDDGDSLDHPRGASTITVMEVAA